MPRRNNQLPQDAITPDNSLEWNQFLAEFGMAFHDDVARFFFLALNQQDDPAEMERLMDYVAHVVRERDVDEFKRMAALFQLVVERLKPEAEPDNPPLSHAAQYELDAQKAGERTSTAGTKQYLKAKKSERSDRQVENIRSRLGVAGQRGRPRKNSS